MPIPMAEDHGPEHKHEWDDGAQNYAHPASLHDALDGNLAKAEAMAGHMAQKGKNLVRNLTGGREIGKLFEGEK